VHLKEPTLSGHQLQLATEVKYLRLTLHKGLTRKTPLGNVINKAYRAFWTCKGTFGKTWGLKPKVLHWIHIMIIRPILTYRPTVWWTRVNYNVSRRGLNKLQRLACPAITGAMKTTTTAPTEVLLGLPPLHVVIEAEAEAGIYRLMCNQQWRPRCNNYGYTKKLRTWSKNPSF
jgi:hypothetical protein